MNTKTPAEQKAKSRQTKSIALSLIVATVIVVTSFVVTFVDYETFAARVVIAGVIIAVTLFCFIGLIRWFKSIDEYEFNVNAKASQIALYSSMFYLPNLACVCNCHYLPAV